MKQPIVIVTVLVGILFLTQNTFAQETSADFGAGSVTIGPDTRACTGALEGAIRYNSTTTCIEVCDGSDWVCRD